jgi:hypothetical protein
MGASLIQLYRVGDDGYIDCKTLSLKKNSLLFFGDFDMNQKRSSGKFCASSRGKTGGASVIRINWA